MSGQEYVVTFAGVVHATNCSHLRPGVVAMPWVSGEQLGTGRPCSRCIGPRIPDDPRNP